MGKTGRLYPPEFKEEAVRLAQSSDQKYPVSKIARDPGVYTETLHRWVNQAEIDAGDLEGLASEEKGELRRLRREVKVLREERETLKKARWIQPVGATLGRVFGVVRIGGTDLANLGRAGLPEARKRELWDRWKAGESISDIARALKKPPPGSIHGVLKATGGIARSRRRRPRWALTMAEREDISRGLASGESMRAHRCPLGPLCLDRKPGGRT